MSPKHPVPTLKNLTYSNICHELRVYYLTHILSCDRCILSDPVYCCIKMSEACEEIMTHLSWSTIVDGVQAIAVKDVEEFYTKIAYLIFQISCQFKKNTFFFTNTGRNVLERFGKCIARFEPCLKFVEPKYLQKVLVLMPNLTVLITKYMDLTTENLSVIGRSCKRLRCILSFYLMKAKLESLEALFINKDGEVNSLCSTMIEFGIEDVFQINWEMESTIKIFCILRHCPNLKSIGNPLNRTGMFIEQFQIEFGINQLNLEELSELSVDGPKLKNYSTLLPNLRSIMLTCPESLESLTNFTKLIHVSLRDAKFSEFRPFLIEHGALLKSLSLLGMDELNLTDLAEFCPNVERLELNSCIYLYPVKLVFKEVAILKLLMDCKDWASVGYRFTDVVRSFPKLQGLYIDKASSVTNADFEDLLTKGTPPFPELVRMTFIVAPRITLKTLRLIIQKCPKLQYFKALTGIDTTTEELDIYNEELNKNNVNVKIEVLLTRSADVE